MTDQGTGRNPSALCGGELRFVRSVAHDQLRRLVSSEAWSSSMHPVHIQQLHALQPSQLDHLCRFSAAAVSTNATAACERLALLHSDHQGFLDAAFAKRSDTNNAALLDVVARAQSCSHAERSAGVGRAVGPLPRLSFGSLVQYSPPSPVQNTLEAAAASSLWGQHQPPSSTACASVQDYSGGEWVSSATIGQLKTMLISKILSRLETCLQGHPAPQESAASFAPSEVTQPDQESAAATNETRLSAAADGTAVDSHRTLVDSHGTSVEEISEEQYKRQQEEKMIAILNGLHREPAGSPQTQKRRQKEEDHPKRPLSAYNFFFRAERAKMLWRTDESVDFDDNQQDIVNKRRKTGKKKIAFEDMARTVAGKWKTIDRSTKEHYQKLAAEDGLRYKREMQEFTKEKRLEAEGADGAFRKKKKRRSQSLDQKAQTN